MFRLVDTVKDSKGISLMEVIIAIAIGLIGVLGSYSFLASMNSTQASNMTVVEAQGEARNIMERMTRELRESGPEVVWPNYADYPDYETLYVYFFTPRNANGEFIINSAGEPQWQRAISYWLEPWEYTLYRSQYYLTWNPDVNDWFGSEIVSKNVESLTFDRVDDMVTINLRTFTDSTEDVGNVARSYADLTTTIRLRN